MWKSLKHHRTSAGLTLGDLSERTGVSVSVLSRIERDQQKLTLDTMIKIAKALGRPLATLLDEEHQPDHPVHSAKSIRVGTSDDGHENPVLVMDVEYQDGLVSFIFTPEVGALASFDLSRAIEHISPMLKRLEN